MREPEPIARIGPIDRGNVQCVHSCPIFAECEARADESMRRKFDYVEDTQARLREVIDPLEGLSPEQKADLNNLLMDEATRLILEVDKSYSFYKGLGRTLVENCHAYPYTRKKYILFGERVLLCSSMYRFGARKELKNYRPPLTIPPPRHSSPE